MRPHFVLCQLCCGKPDWVSFTLRTNPAPVGAHVQHGAVFGIQPSCGGSGLGLHLSALSAVFSLLGLAGGWHPAPVAVFWCLYSVKKTAESAGYPFTPLKPTVDHKPSPHGPQPVRGCCEPWSGASLLVEVPTPRRQDGWTDGWRNGQTDGWMDTWMDGWTDSAVRRRPPCFLLMQRGGALHAHLRP